MQLPIHSITTLLLLLALIDTLFMILTSAHPLHERHHKHLAVLAARESVPFWNDPNWGTKAPDTPRPIATVAPTKAIPTPFADPLTEESAPAKPTTMPSVVLLKASLNPSPFLPAPTPAIGPLRSVSLKASPSPTPGVAPSKPVTSTPRKEEKSCLHVSLWATASGPSPMMSVAGSLSKNKEPICSIWALVDQSSEKPVGLSCMKGHEASFRFDNGAGRYKGEGQPVNFNVVRGEEAMVDGKEAWSWRVEGCWDE